ncbi:SnoaL-like domain-containing protein [Streptomyces sp. HC44]|uniref:SnoaL-like domain-containing protein n=1 Tax=Streptomyces scabichelini TaxID=2711217 RepID=A0A6G4VDX1_9ACTN|nr:limonene-1,2-epoxide hydrolase family protein [Streptomyces scabichelini]NGO12171.1 SnoaL-like domain-containing protein [Streptomyces scabichelini]
MSDDKHELIVREFLTSMGPAPADIRAAVDRFLTDDCVWENPGSPVCRGKEQILALMPAAFARLEVRFRHVATVADTVLVERMETMFRTDGTPLAQNLKVMAAFELRAGRISAWRDYFDHTNLISERPEW